MSERPPLKPGDVLSYSSGAQSRDPYGFRITGPGGNLLGLIQSRWPHLVAGFRGRTPVVINAYPAYIGSFSFGITVDSYLSTTTTSRAFELAHHEGLPVMLLGQPLYIAEFLFRHAEQNKKFPDVLFLGMGGYELPRSLERAMREHCDSIGVKLTLMCGYGVAEVDAACLIAHDRNEQGHFLYETRSPDVDVTFKGEDLYLGLRDEVGGYRVPPFQTGDKGRAEGERFVIWNPKRYHPNVRAILESWKPEDWKRRTGYLHSGKVFRVQLRKNQQPTVPFEVEFFDYARKYGHNWLFKPEWNQLERPRAGRRTLI